MYIKWHIFPMSVVIAMLALVPKSAESQGTLDTFLAMDRTSLGAGFGNLQSSYLTSNDFLFSSNEILTENSDLEDSWKNTLKLVAAIDIVATAPEAIKEEAPEDMTREQIAELMANPFSHLWFGVVQNDTYWWDGDALDLINEDRKIVNTTLVQPVMSLQWSPDWRLIFRPIIPIQSVDTVKGFNFITDEPEGPRIEADFDRKTGLGDIILWGAFSPQYKPPLVYGFGPTIMLDTATDKWLGTGKYSAGPMGTIAYIGAEWIMAGVAQHWWSFAGDSDRNDISLTDVQPIVRYRITKTTNIGIAPNIRYNWEAESGERLSVPFGGGISTVIMLGKLPVGVGIEYYHYVETPDFLGPEQQLRIFFSPVLPAPAWSKVPLFGSN